MSAAEDFGKISAEKVKKFLKSSDQREILSQICTIISKSWFLEKMSTNFGFLNLFNHYNLYIKVILWMSSMRKKRFNEVFEPLDGARERKIML